MPSMQAQRGPVLNFHDAVLWNKRARADSRALRVHAPLFFLSLFPSFSFLSVFASGDGTGFSPISACRLETIQCSLIIVWSTAPTAFQDPPCLSTCPRLSRLVIFFFFLSLLVIHTLCRVENPWRLPDMAMAKVEGGVTLTNCFLHATRRIPTRLHVHDLLSHAPSLFPPRY